MNDWTRRLFKMPPIDGGQHKNYTAAVHRDQWPAWTIPIAAMKSDSDKGIGDTAARMFGSVGGEKFKSWYKTTFGKSCGCEKRQAEWNRLYPYVD